MAAKSQDKILFGAAFLLLLASAGWAFLQNPKIAALKAEPNTNLSKIAYVPTGTDAPKVSTRSWPLAPAQTRGPEWIYDVFTPPEIYYLESTKQFSVTVPVEKPPVVVVEKPFGLEIVSVKQDTFRLQLVGYIGGEGDYRGTFEDTTTGDTVIGRSGKVFPKLGLTVKSFEVKRNVITSKESMPVYDTEATAVVVDSKTGEEIVLTNKRRLIKGTPIATFKFLETSETFERKAGEKILAGGATYTVVNVVAEPVSAEVSKEAPDQPSVTKTLTPPAPVDAVPASPAAGEQPAAAPTVTMPF